MLLSLYSILLFVCVQARPDSRQPLGISFVDGSSLPTLTLPYATYKAQSYDSKQDIYIFANIRFAAPPLDDLRWAPPAEPLHEPGIQDGSIGGTCYQSTPAQFCLAQPALDLFFPESEDCLFLDVYVPGKAIRNASTSNLPVLFWIFGGGFVIGSKDQYGGESLLKTSKNSIIYVRSNYRLGAFGFLSGPSFLKAGGTANAGLLDQIAALKWTQKYISYLGGDPNSITVMGESAGGSSIMHHITANGGTSKPPFHRAILQSPAFQPLYNGSVLNTQFTEFANLAGCPTASFSCLRRQSSQKLQSANLAETLKVKWGHFQFGPSIDGTYVQDLPGRELLHGRFSSEIQIMIGHNSNEGLLFTDPNIVTKQQAIMWMHENFPSVKPEVYEEIEKYYPSPLFGTTRYLTEYDRIKSLIEDALFNCNCLYLARAFGNDTYNYQFSIPPGIHGMDLLFTFYPIAITLLTNTFVLPIPLLYARALQRYFISFVKHGDPNVERGSGTTEWPIFGKDKRIVDVTLLGFWGLKDHQLPEDECHFWQNAIYMEHE